MVTTLKFESRDAASAATAARIAGLLAAHLQEHGSADVVVGGGTSPAKCFEYLAGYEMNWDNIQVMLSDERWVPNDHADSNEKLVRETLLVGEAAAASVLPIYESNLSVDERCDSLLHSLPANGFACSMIGMGADGHFASLFPDAESLAAGLRIGNHCFYIPVRTAASPHPRISMTLQALLQSQEIFLLFFGEEKLQVFEKALAGEQQYPVATLLQQPSPPITLFWAP